MGSERKPQGNESKRALVYCIVPAELAARLHEPLRRHFASDAAVEVVVESRSRDRRRASRRADATGEPASGDERRRVRNAEGRRVGERRSALVPVPAPPLPRLMRRYGDRLLFLERLEPSSLKLEDEDSARLVIRFQGGDREVFADLYRRYFDRVYGYQRVAIRDPHEAEDATQQIFMEVLEGLDRYERRSQPFRAWLFTVARNHAVKRLQKLNRLDVTDPGELDRRREADDPEQVSLDWLTDRELLLFVERLPLAQRQVLVLRYMLGLAPSEVAAVLERSPEAVRQQQARALAFLRARLAAVGRAPKRTPRSGSRLLVPQARVLRARRFVLTTRGATG